MLATVRGKVKRVVMEEFAAVRPSGLIAMSLDEGDQLGWARLTSGSDEVIFVTEKVRLYALAKAKSVPWDGKPPAFRRSASKEMIASQAWMWSRKMVRCWCNQYWLWQADAVEGLFRQRYVQPVVSPPLIRRLERDWQDRCGACRSESR